MSEAEQCRALTEDGERCSRPARNDGFCHQHGPDNETIDDAPEDGNDSENDDESSQEENVSENETEHQEDDEENPAENGEFDVMDVRETVESVADDLVGHPLDGIIEIMDDGDGWEVVVEMVERSAIPDTQDILGQYEISLSESGDVTGYRLRERYRRGDSQEW
ncbi:gas vesicle protein GvpO, halophile-type [Haladaptatus sp. DYF46]|uniref:gas vesicle protein GvpO, halophile-type n=1 Tax=Haladaptatus sp. DYF46 TaxID=2886041 RepID=UPI0026E529CB|nr:gas vesicle protein GvpO [Haladaptatus sp. DYF46]